MISASTVPNYTILGKVAQGAMGHIYRGRHATLEREVAIKFMDPGLVSDATCMERFLREARILASINHPNIVNVFDLGTTAEGQPYMVMEFVSGISLADRLRQGPIELPDVGRIVSQLLSALSTLHTAKIVHRDIKPSNVMLAEGRTPKLLDFGIARATSLASMTNMGKTIGTPNYMSPEQAQGKPVGPASDLYSLGVVLYELLMGIPPFRADNPLSVLMMHIESPIPTLPTSIPSRIRTVVARAMEKSPSRRYSSAEEMLQAVQQAFSEDVNHKTSPFGFKTKSGEVSAFRLPSVPKVSKGPFAAVLCFVSIGGWFVLDRTATLPSHTYSTIETIPIPNSPSSPEISYDKNLRADMPKTIPGKEGRRRAIYRAWTLSMREPELESAQIEVHPIPHKKVIGQRNYKKCRVCAQKEPLSANFCRICGSRRGKTLY